MQKAILLALPLLVLGILCGWSRMAQGGADDRGKALYEARCMLCHGPKGDGKGPGSIALNPKPADYTKRKFWEQPNIEQLMASTVKNGKGQMQASPDLKPEDIQAIINYIEHTFKPH